MPNTNTTSPKSIYQNRLNQYRAQLNGLERTSGQLAKTRGLVAICALIMAWQYFAQNALAPAWLYVALTVFLILVFTHKKVGKRLHSATRAAAYYERRLDYLAGNWQGQGNCGTRYIDHNHPYSSDLDIFGEASLFELVCSTRSRLGEDCLAHWLTSSVDANTVIARQHAIDELREQIDLREQMAVLESDSLDTFEQAQLVQWVETQKQSINDWQCVTSVLLGLLALASIALWAAGIALWPLLSVILLEIVFYATCIKSIQRTATVSDTAGSGLAIISQVMRLIENKPASSALLKQLHSRLITEGHPPSWQIYRLHRLIQALNNCLKNQLVAPLAFLLGLPVIAVHRIERWQQQVGPHITDWFDALGQIEALSSLACYAFENPDDPFPELLDSADKPCFDAQDLAHPLIASPRRVANDIRIDSKQSLIMVSGSNMSGKSTLLRTIGVNLVLALCGAPVKAQKLTTSQFLIGSVMRTHDSLQQGESLFYAVISRIKGVVEQAGQSTPLLFLLDEILQGTNSHDRRIGAESIIRQLLKQNAVGLVTTHDLALTDIVDSLEVGAINIHFEDSLVDGKLFFDYKIRKGPVQKSNALELMRMIGLSVDT